MAEQEFDREISYRGLRIFAVGLAALVLVSAFLMWAFSAYLRDRLVAADPPPPALPEARRPHTPPGPRLQTEFTSDVERLRQTEEVLLTGYAWVDRGAGRVRVPVERAMELVAEEGKVRGERESPGMHEGREGDLAPRTSHLAPDRGRDNP